MPKKQDFASFMAHTLGFGKTARLNFKFFRDCSLVPGHTSGTINMADAMTKIVSRVKMLALQGPLVVAGGVRCVGSWSGSADLFKAQ